MPNTAACTHPDSADSHWRARALIDTDALTSNIRLIRSVAPQSRLMAVIKADAYGHDLNIVCDSIHTDVDGFAVATISEGVQCRKTAKAIPVVVLSELWQQSQLDIFSQHRLQPLVHNENQLDWLKAYRGSPLQVWLKIDSGMNRLGIDSGEVERYFQQLSALDRVQQVRVMSHLANADNREDSYTKIQLKQFQQAVGQLSAEKSLANSAGVLGWPNTHFQWNRPGLILYGVSPFEREIRQPESHDMDLKPVMQLQARLISTKVIVSNQPVGYGGAFRTKRKTRIGLVGLGYGDGYPRLEHPDACVLVNGVRAPIIGRVSMDMITVDITSLDKAETGDTVTLWGRGLAVEEVARWAKTIPYELLCKVTPRIPRIATTGEYHG